MTDDDTIIKVTTNDDHGYKNISSQVDRLLSRIYYTPNRVGSLGGVDALLRAVKKQRPQLNRRTVETWLRTQPPYYMHRRVPKRHFARNKLLYGGVGDLMQADIVFYKDVAQYGYKYLLLVMDTASRYLFYRFMKTKTCKETMRKIKEIFAETKL